MCSIFGSQGAGAKETMSDFLVAIMQATEKLCPIFDRQVQVQGKLRPFFFFDWETMPDFGRQCAGAGKLCAILAVRVQVCREIMPDCWRQGACAKETTPIFFGRQDAGDGGNHVRFLTARVQVQGKLSSIFGSQGAGAGKLRPFFWLPGSR